MIMITQGGRSSRLDFVKVTRRIDFHRRCGPCGAHKHTLIDFLINKARVTPHEPSIQGISLTLNLMLEEQFATSSVLRKPNAFRDYTTF
jgi:cytidine deaminase